MVELVLALEMVIVLVISGVGQLETFSAKRESWH